MSWVPNTDEDRRKMLKAIGVSSFEELLKDIPDEVRLNRPLDLPLPLSELEIAAQFQRLSDENADLDHWTSFLGGGAYDHFIPAAIRHIIGRSEFYTAYTPYQAEVSQGTLQAIYEYQTLICQLTGMEVSNASMYDGASAMAEAALMARATSGRNRVLISGTVNPQYRAVLETYGSGVDLQIETLPGIDGLTDRGNLAEAVDENTACVILQNPNFLGVVEDLSQVAETIHGRGALFIVVVDPISLGILKSPGEYGADVVVGEGQGLGNQISFGGPFLGFFACREELVRRVPGRLVGTTTDTQGRRGFVLTLQTREQHIRRERATSNICSNEALNALAATVYLSLMGKVGIGKVAELCLHKSHYAAEEIDKLKGFELRFRAPFFKEFAVRTPKPPRQVVNRLVEKKILAGVDLGRFNMGLNDCLLIAVTEKRTRSEIDALVEALGER